MIKKVITPDERSVVCDKILRSLPKWFGIESSIVDYVKDVKAMETWASYSNSELTGFVSINKHNDATAEIHVIGVIESFHKKGIGKILIHEAEKYLGEQKFKYLTVKTLSELRADENYEKTRHFYLAVGFSPVEVFKTLWGEHNPCLLMIKNIESINNASVGSEQLSNGHLCMERDMKTAKIYAIAGQIGSGKTTYARKLAKEKKAIFFSIDQWIAELGVTIGSYEVYSQYYPGCQNRIREIVSQAIDFGTSVVFDFGVNQARGRKGLKEFADKISADLEIHHLSVPLEVCKKRVRERNQNKPKGIYSFHFSEDDFEFVAKNYELPTADEEMRIVEVENLETDTGP